MKIGFKTVVLIIFVMVCFVCFLISYLTGFNIFNIASVFALIIAIESNVTSILVKRYAFEVSKLGGETDVK